jgi:hypothetical protein
VKNLNFYCCTEQMENSDPAVYVTALVTEASFLGLQRYGKICPAVDDVIQKMTGDDEDYDKLSEREKKKIVKYQSGMEESAHMGIRHLFRRPIFTFTESWVLENQPWFTGDMQLFNVLKAYISAHQGTITHAKFYVPYTRGYELGLRGKKHMQWELRHTTDDEAFKKTFDRYPHEVLTFAQKFASLPHQFSLLPLNEETATVQTAV